MTETERLILKSTLCAHSQGVFEEESQMVEGEPRRVRVKRADAPRIEEATKFTIDKRRGVVSVKNGSETQELPVVFPRRNGREIKFED